VARRRAIKRVIVSGERARVFQSVQVGAYRVLVFPYGQKRVTWQCPDCTDLTTVLCRRM
jgi:hypothetical protein